jgi:tetratricopeptide (TPR) repeat protein
MEEDGLNGRAQIAMNGKITLRRSWYLRRVNSCRASAAQSKVRPHRHIALAVRGSEQSAADLDTAIQLTDRPYLRFLRGLVSCQRGRYKESLADFDHAIREQPDNTQFYRGRSLARSKTGRYREALEDAERLVSLVPQQAESHYAMGTALAGQGRWNNAIEAYGEAMRRRPELLYPLRARAEAFERIGNRDRASADFAELARRERDESLCAPCRDPFRY